MLKFSGWSYLISDAIKVWLPRYFQQIAELPLLSMSSH